MNDKFRTIVGGRSRSDRIVGDFPRGIEILLKKASVNSEFSQYLLQDPINAAKSISLDLKPAEADILTNTTIPILKKMITNTHVPRQHIKIFRNAAATVMLALVLGTTAVVPELVACGSPELPSQGPEQEELTRNRMALVQEALEAYKKDHGTYPSTRTWYEQLSPMTDYATQIDLYDPWRRRFHYNAVKEDGKIINYKLESFGLDMESAEDNIPCPLNTDQHRFTGVSPINILFPTGENSIPVNAQLPPDERKIQLKAEHENEEVMIYWYLNGVDIGTTVKEHNLTVEAVAGGNTLLLVDENEEGASIDFYVYEKESSDESE